jgi:hypothetical protein
MGRHDSMRSGQQRCEISPAHEGQVAVSFVMLHVFIIDFDENIRHG